MLINGLKWLKSWDGYIQFSCKSENPNLSGIRVLREGFLDSSSLISDYPMCVELWKYHVAGYCCQCPNGTLRAPNNTCIPEDHCNCTDECEVSEHEAIILVASVSPLNQHRDCNVYGDLNLVSDIVPSCQSTEALVEIDRCFI